jgi:protoporphyrin/coproporphyrin ferrochelatase
MKTAVIVVNFGEPAEATLEQVEPFLERIFLQNAGLEPGEAAARRARQLARDRAPGLIEEYASIGGSPLKAQADAQAVALEAELVARGHDVSTFSCFQFVEPLVREGVERARAAGARRLVALPVYPLCGESTTAAAVTEVRRALEELEWHPDLRMITGWHHHPDYLALRADHVRDYVASHGLDLRDPDTILYFSVHGTPIQYLEAGNRYDRYVEEHCRDVATRLGAERYAVGFQNHTNRGILWTQPDNEDRIRDLSERRLVVVPISFMHEQSETLAELDEGVRSFVEGLGKELHRVPVPHDAARFHRVLADLVEEVLGHGDGDVLSRCRCVRGPSTWCTNACRELPPSPFVPTAA